MTEQPVVTVFLDRDGVINRRIIDGYVTHPDELVMLNGAPTAISRLSRAGFRTVVVTNQRGIALGHMTRGDVDRIHGLIQEAVTAKGGSLDGFYVCPHDRDTDCLCRKPKPGLLDQADTDKPVDWRRSFLVGDSISDIQAGLARGVTTIKLIGPSDGLAHHDCADLSEAVAWILQQTGSA